MAQEVCQVFGFYFYFGGVMKFMDSDIYVVALIVFAILFVFVHVVLYLTK